MPRVKKDAAGDSGKASVVKTSSFSKPMSAAAKAGAAAVAAGNYSISVDAAALAGTKSTQVKRKMTKSKVAGSKADLSGSTLSASKKVTKRGPNKKTAAAAAHAKASAKMGTKYKGAGTGGKAKPGPKAKGSGVGAKSGLKGKPGPKGVAGPKASPKPRGRQPGSKTGPSKGAGLSASPQLGKAKVSSKDKPFPKITPLLTATSTTVSSGGYLSGRIGIDDPDGFGISGTTSPRLSKKKQRSSALSTGKNSPSAASAIKFRTPTVSLEMPTPTLPRTNVTVYRPIVFGTISFPLGADATEYKTHQWYVYVRGVECEDLSYFIKSVSFALHPSFQPPVRTVEKPPYEVMEYGWGEFSIGIRIVFQDPTIAPVDQVHMLKLYHPQTSSKQTISKKPVLHEQYDEIVFKNPPTTFYNKLMKGPQIEHPRHPLTDFFKYDFSEINDLKRIQDAQAYVDKELSTVKRLMEEKRMHLTKEEGLALDEAHSFTMLPVESVVGTSGEPMETAEDRDMNDIANLLN
eukprot:Stramenopile-MAST_4_protein_509